MSDNFGLNQSRVLDSDNRNFESVIYQWKKPPLSSEVNLTGTLVKTSQQNVAGLIIPSGWTRIGDIKDNATENLCYAGDVITSSSYGANKIKLIALEKGVETGTLTAWVNGWKINVQGTSSTDENNIITFPAPPALGYRVDFVFLEVWRKLIETDDTVYKHGNFLYGGTNLTNDLIDPAIGIETSLRVQIQYRIRVATSDITVYPDGFDPYNVFVQGPLAFPINTCTHAYFSPVPGHPGLWRAGAGDSAAQEDLQTVDGYTYAIPMFAVHRRNTHAFDTDTFSNGSGKSLADYLLGYASDRPDNRYNNWIVAEDILDMRHKVSSDENMKELCESSFYKLYTGSLRGKLGSSSLGEDHLGVVLTQVDSISMYTNRGATQLAAGDGYRRVFSNTDATQANTLFVRSPLTDKYYGTAGAWAATDQVQILLSGYPTGSVVSSLEGIYSSDSTGYLNTSEYTVSGIGTYNVLVTIDSSSVVLVGTTKPITLDYTIDYPNGANGLTFLPDSFLEFRKEDTTSAIATTDATIRARQSAPVITSAEVDATKFIQLTNYGASVPTNYLFGHQMTYHLVGSASSVVTFPRTIDGYEILGIISVKYAGAYKTWTTVSRDTNTYTVDLSPLIPDVGRDIEFVLYTRAKFFKTNSQGRALLETYEMTNITADETANGSRTSFHINTINRPILAIGSTRDSSGYCFAYANGIQKNLDTNNSLFPVDETKSRATINFTTSPAASGAIEVPVLMLSAVGNVDGTATASEGYNIYYKTIPYQGILDSTVVGVIEAEGPAITTTSGSGSQLTDLNLKNIVDRLPTYNSDNDSLAKNENIATAVSEPYPVLETKIISRVQDIIGEDPNTVVFGVSAATSGRGRYQVSIPGAELGLGNFGLKFEKLDTSASYQKTYQSYILNKENNGELYLMVVGSETGSDSTSRIFNENSNNDTMDIFQIPGRPLTVRRSE